MHIITQPITVDCLCSYHHKLTSNRSERFITVLCTIINPHAIRVKTALKVCFWGKKTTRSTNFSKAQNSYFFPECHNYVTVKNIYAFCDVYNICVIQLTSYTSKMCIIIKNW